MVLDSDGCWPSQFLGTTGEPTYVGVSKLFLRYHQANLDGICTVYTPSGIHIEETALPLMLDIRVWPDG